MNVGRPGVPPKPHYCPRGGVHLALEGIQGVNIERRSRGREGYENEDARIIPLRIMNSKGRKKVVYVRKGHEVEDEILEVDKLFRKALKQRRYRARKADTDAQVDDGPKRPFGIYGTELGGLHKPALANESERVETAR